MVETVNDLLMDSAIRHQIGLQRYSTATVRKILRLLNRVDADIVRMLNERLPGATTEFGRKRLETLLASLRKMIQEGYAELHPTLQDEMMELAQYEVEYNTNVIQKAVPIKLNMAAPTVEQLASVVNSRPFQGRLLKEWTDSLEESAYIRVRDAIRIGFTEGETIDQMVRRIRGTKAKKYRDGILEINRRNAEGVVRTAVAHVANSAREELYNANDDLIEAIVWVSTLDGRTTETCIIRDGLRYTVSSPHKPIGHSVPWNGGPGRIHFRCRSSSYPQVASFRALGIDLDEAPAGTRASMNGVVAAETTYPEWLKKQPREFVEDVLGKTKAKLFLDGNLAIQKFEDRRGDSLTLKELRQKEKEAFLRAGL